MIAVDTNLLVYAHREDSDFHDKTLVLLKELAESGAPWAIPWPCLHEFLAIATHPRIFDPPTPVPVALEAMHVWMTAPACTMLGEGEGYFDTLKDFMSRGRVTGGLVHDARIAALCAHHRVRELWSVDRDFSRFPDVKTVNPLLEA